MYSPKIDPALIRPLYYLGQAKNQPMTRVVNELLYEGLASRKLPPAALEHFGPAIRRFPHLQPPQRKDAA